MWILCGRYIQRLADDIKSEPCFFGCKANNFHAFLVAFD
jgi:hypothetical protein